MLRGIDGTADKFLADLDRTQASTDRAQRQVSSGLKIERPSDAPDQIVRLMQLRSEIARNTQVQTNLNQVKNAVATADTSIQSAITLLDNASSLAVQGASSLSNANQRQDLAQQVQSLEEQMISLSRTQVAGSYIFSGDQDQSPSYQLNLSSSTGVDRLITPTNTQQIQDVDGSSFSAAQTAQDLFDHRNADGTVASDNVFNALNQLRVALQNNDQAGINSSIDSLHSAGDSLNVRLGFYGAVEDRINNALDQASKLSVQQKSDLSDVQDADLPAATVAMSQGQIQQEAAMAAQAKMPKTSLFDFLA